MDWRPFRVVLFACLAFLLTVALSPVTHAQTDGSQSQIDEAVDQALSDRGKINLGSPPKYPYLFHTFWFEKGDWAWGMGLDLNYENTFITGDDLKGTPNELRDFTGFDEVEYRFGARLDQWLDLYVSADFAANNNFANGAGGLPGGLGGFHQGDVRWAIMDMHALPIPGFSNLRVGQQILPLSLDNWTSPQNGSFIHKSYVGAFTGAYHQGFTLWDFKLEGSPKLVYSLGVGKQSESGNPARNHIVSGPDSDNNNDVDVYGQLGWYPWFRGSGNMLYTEISGGLFKADQGSHMFAFPGIGHGAPGSSPALSVISAPEYTPIYLSSRYSNGPFSVWGDYATVEADNCANCSGSSESDMFHLTTSYFLTGESKPWGAPVGVNVRAKPDQPYNPTKPGVEGYGSGAVELKARYQEIDMSEFGPAGPPPSNRENWALGVNWYLTENLIFMTEYEHETLLEQGGDEQSLLNTQLNLRM